MVKVPKATSRASKRGRPKGSENHGGPSGSFISAHAGYSLDEFRRRTGLGLAAWRKARRAGLRYHRFGGRVFIVGADWLAFLAGHSSSPNEGNS